MGQAIRLALVAIGAVLFIAGLALVAGRDPGGLSWVLTGGFLILVTVLERRRYRSEASERTNAAPGPGGGETAETPLETRFRPTAEVFDDPTTGHRMRVLVDPATGERRYLAEG